MTDSVDAYNEARELLERVLEDADLSDEAELMKDIEKYLEIHGYREYDE